MTSLTGKVVLITGTTSGLGRQFALAVAGAGGIVVVSGRRKERLDALVAEIASTGGIAHAVALDVTDTAACAQAINHVWDTIGPIWGLVNNSGVSIVKPIAEVTPDDYDYVMNTNLRAPYFLAQAVARRMIEVKTPGRVVNIASIGAFVALGNGSVYSMSKAAVAHMTHAMAKEWARYDINVNAICPGYIRTEMNSEFFDSPAGQKMIHSYPKRRIGNDDDLNGLLLLLLSDKESRFITGSLMTADDGQML